MTFRFLKASILVTALHPNFQLKCFSFCWRFKVECCPVYSRDNFNRPGLLYNYFASICLPALLVAVEENHLPRMLPYKLFSKWLNRVNN